MWCSRTVKGTAAQVGDGRVTAGRYPACEPLRNQPIASINKKVGEAILNFLELQGGEITSVGVFGLVFFFFFLFVLFQVKPSQLREFLLYLLPVSTSY